ncbi:ABC transporter permease [Spirillospora sp. NPDC127200]
MGALSAHAHGAGLVARQEVRVRLRTGRWKVLLGIWAAVVNGLGLLFRISLESDAGGERDQGVPMFGGVLLAVLALCLLITPALTGQSVNGDRERGTLAALQITRLAPVDIALGKLLAAWGAGLLVLALTLPCVLFPVVEGAITVGRAAAVLAVTALLIGVVCALSQAWSALVARSITSVLLSYLTVLALFGGTLLAFTLALPLTSEPRYYSGDTGVRLAYHREKPEKVWWLLAPNPVVVLADAAPRLPERKETVYGDEVVRHSESDPLGDLGRSMREVRAGDDRDEDVAGPVWPYGLAFDVLLAVGAFWVTTRRLRTPVRAMPKGVRLA